MGQVVRAIMGPRPELLDDELELLLEDELELLLEELELLDDELLDVLPDELELDELEELDVLPDELELLLELAAGELVAGSAPHAVRPVIKLVANRAAGMKRANECWRNTNAFMKSSWDIGK